MRANSLVSEMLEFMVHNFTKILVKRAAHWGTSWLKHHWCDGFINMSDDRKLSRMIDDVGGKRSDGFFCLTIYLSPEQLFILPNGCGCLELLRGCDVSAACTPNIITICLGKSQRSSSSSTHPVCAQRMFLIPLWLWWLNSQLRCYGQLVL